MVSRETEPTPEGQQVSDRMHIPVVPAERSRPGMSTGRITAAALQIVDTEGCQALTMRRLGQAAVLRIPARTHPRRATGPHRQPRPDRRPAPPRPALPPTPRIP